MPAKNVVTPCVVQDALIRFVNVKLQLILEKAEADLVDRPFTQFVHGDDRAVLMERYRKPWTATRCRPRSSFAFAPFPGCCGSVTRATQFEWAGRPATLYFIDLVQAEPA